jgi:porin
MKRLFYILISLILPIASSMAQENVVTDSVQIGEGKSGYDNLAPAGGVNSVKADLVADDALKMQWLDVNISKKVFKPYYGFKRKLNDGYRVAIGSDYMFLNQLASFSFSDKMASSGVFRFYGTWDALITENGYNGSFIVKFENRHKIGKQQLPRQLGYEAGSAMSTASYKDFRWGLTNFYWKQFFMQNRIALVVGIMDAGDWIDLYPLLNPFKYFLNEAYFNSPAMALPNQGLGVSAFFTVAREFYLSGGMHDANGQPENFFMDNFRSFFQQKEYFYWIEAGWKAGRPLLGGETVHLTYWYQEERVEQGTETSKGWCFSASRRFGSYLPFVRAAISEGNGALMHHLVMAGVGIDAFRGDNLGFALNWGGPYDRSLRDQYSMELYYAIQLTQHVNIMPDIQLTLNPSFNESRDVVAVYSTIRLRYAL